MDLDSMDFDSTEHFDCFTFYFKVAITIQGCTMYKDISSISIEEFTEFKKEYESYKIHILRTIEKKLKEYHSPACKVDIIHFFDKLHFIEIIKHASYSTQLTVTLPNRVAKNAPRDITFFQNILETEFRLRSSFNPNARFFFRDAVFYNFESSRLKEILFKHKIINGEEEQPNDGSLKNQDKPIVTTVVNVKVKFLRSGASSFSKKTYNNLKEWMDDPENVYIGRKESVFIDGERFPKEDSLWSNPYKVTRGMPPRTSCRKYEEYIISRIANERDFIKKLIALKGKNLGCWCKEKGDEMCHGDVLLKLLQAY